jgi:hypothetical protein
LVLNWDSMNQQILSSILKNMLGGPQLNLRGHFIFELDN